MQEGGRTLPAVVTCWAHNTHTPLCPSGRQGTSGEGSGGEGKTGDKINEGPKSIDLRASVVDCQTTSYVQVRCFQFF